jgi:hypothetical protein
MRDVMQKQGEEHGRKLRTKIFGRTATDEDVGF